MQSKPKNVKKVLLLLPNGSEILEAAAFIDVFGWHQAIGAATCKLITCSNERELSLSFGQSMLAQVLLDETMADDYAALALPGGFGCYGYYEQACSEPYLCLIRNFDKQNKPIAAICTAAIVLAKAGLLKNKRATTYNKEAGWAEQLQKAGVNFTDAPLMVEGHIITSQNPASAVPVALKLLEWLAGMDERSFIQEQMGF
ncbi:MAG: DJ-1/PfpI family protein [Clostridiales bacterium]|nr:DJ-1/PfpI family protein [Clostridiales bacterium]